MEVKISKLSILDSVILIKKMNYLKPHVDPLAMQLQKQNFIYKINYIIQMIEGKKYNSVVVDIWSSGVILFALLCGFLPFEDQNTSNLYKKIIGG